MHAARGHSLGAVTQCSLACVFLLAGQQQQQRQMNTNQFAHTEARKQGDNKQQTQEQRQKQKQKRSLCSFQLYLELGVVAFLPLSRVSVSRRCVGRGQFRCCFVHLPRETHTVRSLAYLSLSLFLL